MDEITRLAKISLAHPEKIIKALTTLVTQGPKVVALKIKRQDILEDYNAFVNSQYLKWFKKTYPSKKEFKKIKYQPKISIITPTFNTPEKYLRECIESVINQWYDNFELCLSDDCSSNPKIKKIIAEYAKKDSRIKFIFRSQNGHISQASNSALKLASGEFVAILDHDDILWPNALYEVVKLLNQQRQADLIYSDEDKVTADSRLHLDPFFKPDWSPDYLRSINYLNHLVVIRRSLIKKVGGFRIGFEGAQDWDLFLRIIFLTKKISHIPKVLYSWRISEQSSAGETGAKKNKMYAFNVQQKVLEEDLKRRNYKGKVLPSQYLGLWHLRYNLKKLPLVSIIIPTKNQYHFIKRCLWSILQKTTYKNFQLVIVDTGSTDEKVWQLYNEIKKQHRRTKVFNWKDQFNFSLVCNFGAQSAQGEYLLFLNNDTEILTADWIECLLEHAFRPEVGAVGCKLLFPNGRIQHVGVTLGIAGGLVKKGVAGHPFKNFFNKEVNNGYARVVDTMRDVSAVTAACLLVSRQKFDSVNGFDPSFRVAFNDVDFCLKLIQKGLYNLYTPLACLKHWESISVGKPGEGGRKVKEFLREVALMHQKWGKLLQNDPYYNPNLTLKSEEVTLKE